MAPSRSGPHRVLRAAAAAVLAFASSGLLGRASAQKVEPPKWLDDNGKDLFMQLETETEDTYGKGGCELREKLLLKMAGKADKDAPLHRAMVLLGLGVCEYIKGNYVQSTKRLLSTIADMDTGPGGGEDMMLKHPAFAHIPLMKQAAQFMSKQEPTQAGTSLRRCREVLERNVKKLLKQFHQQQKQSVPINLLYDEISGYGKTGTYLPQMKKENGRYGQALVQDLAWIEVMDQSLDALDASMAAVDKAQKMKRTKLDVSKGKKGTGTLLYVRALLAEPIIDADRLAVAKELSTGVAKALVAEAAALEKPATLLKRSKEGSACQKDKGLGKTCAALVKVPDVQSNGFGEVRVVIAKADKKQALDVCSTNANVGILIAAKDGARVSVAGLEEPTALKAGEPVGIDFCREASLEADGTTPVLFVQVWHPEFAAVERTTELRTRSEAFGLSEGEVKSLTKVVNDHAKANWEKVAKKWREGSPGLADLKTALQSEADDKAKKAKEAAEAKRREDEAGDEERQKALEELKKKREAKAKAAAEKEELRKKREKMREEERAKRDPWLNAPEVGEMEAKIAELKEQRRDANAKLEFDESTRLTKEVSNAERQLKKIIKKARKEYKKTGKVPTAPLDKDSAEDKETPEEGGELAKLKSELQSVKEQKAEASKNEKFKEAKRLKQKQQELEAQIAKLEL